MTIFDFFTKQTEAQIQEAFRENGITSYLNVPKTKQSFCTLFNLENDENITVSVNIYKEDHLAEISCWSTFPNPQFPTCPISFDTEYHVTSKYKKCNVSRGQSMSFEQNVTICKEISDVFDKREQYHFVEYWVFLCYLHGIVDYFIREDNGRRKYYLKSEYTIFDMYNEVCKHLNHIAPLIRMFLASVNDGSWEKIWNNLYPREKWNFGHEHFKEYFFPNAMAQWGRAVKAGIEPKIDDFVKYFIATACCKLDSEYNDDVMINWDESTNSAVIERFKKILSDFDKKYILDESMNKWNNSYQMANNEFLSELETLKELIAEKYGINPKYIDVVAILKKTKDNHWFGTDVPEDAYITSKNKIL